MKKMQESWPMSERELATSDGFGNFLRALLNTRTGIHLPLCNRALLPVKAIHQVAKRTDENLLKEN
jgi:hypothetical protein